MKQLIFCLVLFIGNTYLIAQEPACPLVKDDIQHFVYFARDREAIRNHPFLECDRLVGAQIMYAWRELEPTKGVYDFSRIQSDYLFLKSKGKKLFIQLQDATFMVKSKAIPAYLESDVYDGGALFQRTDDGQPEGWVAKRWNPEVQERFSKLLLALGQEFDGKIEGINLQETAIGVSKKYDPTFSPPKYLESVLKNMDALKGAFPISAKIQYANFMPGEWLPWEDKGYLKKVYQHGQNIGVGLGAPDLMPEKKGQQNHALKMMTSLKFQVPLAIAIQDGNYIGQTNSNKVLKSRQNLVPKLHDFALDKLKVNYLFWSNQQPYFMEDVWPCLGCN